MPTLSNRIANSVYMTTHGYQKEKQAQVFRLEIKSIQSDLSWLRGSYTGVLKFPQLLLSVQDDCERPACLIILSSLW
ncbi:hypothetical protein Ancab_033190, partial [Ancistrocladus abbreviatus]